MQRAFIIGSVSDWAVVSSDILLGMVAGPVLLTAFVSDLPNCIESAGNGFADDIKVPGGGRGGACVCSGMLYYGEC